MTLIGIHTPESAGEKDMEAVRRKARENGLEFPIAVDNDSKNWNAWANRTWPSTYLIDKAGHVRFWWYGELQGPGVDGEKFLREKIEGLLGEPADE